MRSLAKGIAVLLFVALLPLHVEAGPKEPSRTVDADSVLQELREGANLRAFGKAFALSDSSSWVDVTDDNVKDQQGMFDGLLAELASENRPHVIVGAGLLAVELDRVLGRTRDNQVKLVEFLASQLCNTDESCRLFALRSLTDDYFEAPSVFSKRARKTIYEAYSKHPQLVDLYTYDAIDANRSVIMLIGKAGETPEGKELLNDIRKKNPKAETTCSAALARMGVEREQRELITRFEDARNLDEKYRLAYALADWGGRKAQEALAKALRTPGFVFGGEARLPEMLRLHIAIALVRTIREARDELPRRGCFAWTDEDFDMIEKWATKHLGTTWNVPRPEHQPVRRVKF